MLNYPIHLSRESNVNLLIILILFFWGLGFTLLDEEFYVLLAARVCIMALAGVGLNLALGYGGMVSFGHAAFFGIGGYTAGILLHHSFEASPIAILPIFEGSNNGWIIFPVLLIVSLLFSLFIGVISLRTSGVYFIMITLALAQMLYYLAISFPTYGGEDGLPLNEKASFIFFDIDNSFNFFLLCFVLLMGFTFLVYLIVNSRFGLALKASRQNTDRLQSVGIDPFGIKLVGFVLSAIITSFAGALLVNLDGFVSPDILSWHNSGEIMIFVILGGSGRLFGPVIGAFVFILMETIIGSHTEYWQLFLGFFLLAIVLYANGGMMGFLTGTKNHD